MSDFRKSVIMSLSSLNEADARSRQIRIYVLSSVKREGVTYYRIGGRLASSGMTWEVTRRYSEFLLLRDQLIRFFESAKTTCPGCVNYFHSICRFDFPKKHFLSSNASIVVKYRVQAFRAFMNLLASWNFSNTPKCPTCGGFAFEVVRNFILDGATPETGGDVNSLRSSFADEMHSSLGSSTTRASTTSNNRRPPLPRRPSWQATTVVDSNGPKHAQTTRPARDKSGKVRASDPSLMRRTMRDDARRQDVYDAFNDYLPASKQKRDARARRNTEETADTTKFNAQSARDKEKERYGNEPMSIDELGGKPMARKSSSRKMERPSSGSSNHGSRVKSSSSSRMKEDGVDTPALYMPKEQMPGGNSMRRSYETDATSTDEDEIDVTGIVMDGAHVSKSKSRSHVWQSWERAHAG